VGRSAQDDGFVGILTKNILNKLALLGTVEAAFTSFATAVRARMSSANLAIA
jgi:hypothetical protein